MEFIKLEQYVVVDKIIIKVKYDVDSNFKEFNSATNVNFSVFISQNKEIILSFYFANNSFIELIFTEISIITCFISYGEAIIINKHFVNKVYYKFIFAITFTIFIIFYFNQED